MKQIQHFENRPEPTSYLPSTASFVLLSEQQVVKLSTVEITTSSTLSQDPAAGGRRGQLQPIPNGLYDLRMGPHTSGRELWCHYCGGTYSTCPGHHGHISLRLPVFHPISFSFLKRLVKAYCFACCRIKLKPSLVRLYCYVMIQLRLGRVQEALDLRAAAKSLKASKNPPQQKEKPMEQQNEGQQDDAMEIDGVSDSAGLAAVSSSTIRMGLKELSKSSESWSQHAQLELIETIKEFFNAAGGTKRCQKCHAVNPGIRAERMRVFLGGESAPKTKGKAKRQRKEQEELEEGRGEDGTGTISLINSSVLDKNQRRYLNPAQLQEAMRRLWSTETVILNVIFGDLKYGAGRQHVKEEVSDSTVPHTELDQFQMDTQGYQRFFVNKLLVTYPRYRPPMQMGTMVAEHPQTVKYVTLIEHSQELAELQEKMLQLASADQDLEDTMKQFQATWNTLQLDVNAIMDSSLAQTNGPGIRQTLERKQGLFRQNMMGKRVNMCARTIICPDPFLKPGQVGLPGVFAAKLGLYVKVADYNRDSIRDALMEGVSGVKRIKAKALILPSGKRVELSHLQNDDIIRKLASQHLTKPNANLSTKAIRQTELVRACKDGDWVLTNRQPSLHRASIMAHQVKVLPMSERVIRFHYSNCAALNADFDGDELNIHALQDEPARAEASVLAAADQQFIIPTDGKPVRGLIQDHVGSASILTAKSTFLTRSQMCQLFHQATTVRLASMKLQTRYGQRALPQMPMPALWVKNGSTRTVLWTGKQLIEWVVAACCAGYGRNLKFTLSCGAKVSSKYLYGHPDESVVHFFGGRYVHGIFDKSQFGKGGVLHVVYELYGHEVAADLTSALTRMLTYYLCDVGFTCGIDDTMMTAEQDEFRELQVKGSDMAISKATGGWLSADASIEFMDQDGLTETDTEWRQYTDTVTEKLKRRLTVDRTHGRLEFDRIGQGAANKLAGDICSGAIPGGLYTPFPKNCIALMTVTGAKGSSANLQQITQLLGQQSYEGTRAPLNAAGRTLACFVPYDTGARAYGFVGDRYLDGLRPQEYFFHSMSGREGLVDTAVKTASSGYMQRCAVKSLEGLRVHADVSVRDDADNALVQFKYGDDGCDVTKTSFMDDYGFLANNAPVYKAIYGQVPALPPAQTKQEEARQKSNSITLSMAANKERQQIQKLDRSALVADKASMALSLGCSVHQLVNEEINSDRIDLEQRQQEIQKRVSKLRKKKGKKQQAIYPQADVTWFDEQHKAGQDVVERTQQVTKKFNKLYQKVRQEIYCRLEESGQSCDANHVSDILDKVLDHVKTTQAAEASDSNDAPHSGFHPEEYVHPGEATELYYLYNAVRLLNKYLAKQPALTTSPSCYEAGMTPKLESILGSYISHNPLDLLKQSARLKTCKFAVKQGQAWRSGPVTYRHMEQLTAATLRSLAAKKFNRSVIASGEGVGIIAAQSIGEPSTQMTLNTFHQAGRGEANVTLGIPRLREVIMGAGRTSTPLMRLPLNDGCNADDAQFIKKRLQSIRVAEAVQDYYVYRYLINRSSKPSGSVSANSICVLLLFHPLDTFDQYGGVGWKQIEASAIKLGQWVYGKVLKDERDSNATVPISLNTDYDQDKDDARAGPDAGAENGNDSQAGGAGTGNKNNNDNVDDDSESDVDSEAPGKGDDEAEGKLRFKQKEEDGVADADDDQAQQLEEMGVGRGSGKDEWDDDEDENEDDGGQKEQVKTDGDGLMVDEDGVAVSAADVGAGTDVGNVGEGAGQDREVKRRKKGKKKEKAQMSGAGVDGGSSSIEQLFLGKKQTVQWKPVKVRVGSYVDVEVEVCEHSNAARLIINLHQSTRHVDVQTILRKAMTNVYVRQLEGIKKVHIEEQDDVVKGISTEGVNFHLLSQFDTILDVNSSSCTDIQAVNKYLGIEAARTNIVQQVQDVFRPYGITSNYRHLGLLADYMTHAGSVRGCSRMGIQAIPSPLLKMTFETAYKFLQDATILRQVDNLTTPSARLVVGRVCSAGTGSVGLTMPMGQYRGGLKDFKALKTKDRHVFKSHRKKVAIATH